LSRNFIDNSLIATLRAWHPTDTGSERTPAK